MLKLQPMSIQEAISALRNKSKLDEEAKKALAIEKQANNPEVIKILNQNLLGTQVVHKTNVVRCKNGGGSSSLRGTYLIREVRFEPKVDDIVVSYHVERIKATDSGNYYVSLARFLNRIYQNSPKTETWDYDCSFLEDLINYARTHKDISGFVLLYGKTDREKADLKKEKQEKTWAANEENKVNRFKLDSDSVDWLKKHCKKITAVIKDDDKFIDRFEQEFPGAPYKALPTQWGYVIRMELKDINDIDSIPATIRTIRQDDKAKDSTNQPLALDLNKNVFNSTYSIWGLLKDYPEDFKLS